ncbi:MAG: hypothetical protein JOZ48_16505 [Acidobacteriaceae bacterium]|nr:hypothetical protein [Acidobacteriaceae bacterium]
MKIPNAFRLDPSADGLMDQIAAVPASSGIYVLVVRGRPTHMSWTANLRRRLARLLNPAPIAGKGLLESLRNTLAAVECWATGSRLETSLLMYELGKTYFPDDYLKRLRLRMPWFVGLTSQDLFPRLTVVNRLPRKAGALFGPFSSRDSAQRYGDEVLGLFQIRRCTENLNPHPEHPGCIYGEMNQCLRPCQCAVTPEEYGSESARVAEFLASNGKSLVTVLASARDRASVETDFEQAALIHKRIEKATAAAGARDGAVAEVHEFNGVALTRATETGSLRFWPMLAGHWQTPITLSFSGEERSAKSLDQELREGFADSERNRDAGGNRIEELAIFARWYYSSWRDGEWFPFHSIADLNYRRLVREISKMMKADVANATG